MIQCDYCKAPATKVDLANGKEVFICDGCLYMRFLNANGWIKNLVSLEVYEEERNRVEELLSSGEE